MILTDTHTHLYSEAFDDDRDILLSSMKENGIGLIVNIGSSISSTRAAFELTKKYDFVYGVAGVHPNETAELEEIFIMN